MSEEEKETLVSKRKYWTKFMKYNLANTVLVPPLSGIIYEFLNWRIDANFEWMATIIMFWAFFTIISWPLSFIMYVYHSLKIHEITNSQPRVLSNSQALTTSQISAMKEAKELLDKNIITKSEFDEIKNEYTDSSVVTRLKGIADLRDSKVFTEREFQEQKSKILSEATSRNNENLSFNNKYKDVLNGKNVAIGGIVGIIILISIISLLSFLGTSDGARVYIEGEYTYNYGLCWSGAFHDGDSIISISGCGNEEFYCTNGDFCSINAQKDEDNSYELCVKIYTYKDRETTEACTTAGYGIAQV